MESLEGSTGEAWGSLGKPREAWESFRKPWAFGKSQGAWGSHGNPQLAWGSRGEPGETLLYDAWESRRKTGKPCGKLRYLGDAWSRFRRPGETLTNPWGGLNDPGEAYMGLWEVSRNQEGMGHPSWPGEAWGKPREVLGSLEGDASG